MTKFVNALIAGTFAAGLAGAPAAFAQTTDRATSTGETEVTKDKNEMDSVQKNQATPTDGSASAPEGRKSMDDGTTGSTSNSTPKAGKPLGATDTQD